MVVIRLGADSESPIEDCRIGMLKVRGMRESLSTSECLDIRERNDAAQKVGPSLVHRVIILFL